MTGLPNFNFPAFENAASLLRSSGWSVYSPRENDAEKGIEPDPEGLVIQDESITFKDLMKTDLWQVCDSDAVFVLPGWEYSRGALLEVHVAHRIGVPVFSLLSGREIEAPKEDHDFSIRHVLDRVKPDGEPVSHDEPVFEHDSPYIYFDHTKSSVLDCGPKTRFRDEETGGEKEESQARFDLIPPDALTALARIYGMGASKYAANNYLKGYPWHLSIAALERHVQKFKAGEDYDEESGLPHLAHAAWQCFTLLVFLNRGLGTDDRYPVKLAS